MFGIILGAGIVGLIAIATALLGLWKMEETFSKDLDYLEGIDPIHNKEKDLNLLKVKDLGLLKE
jgi:hypothetical protein